VVFSYDGAPFEQLRHGFAGVTGQPQNGEAFDPRATAQRFDLHGRAAITIPLVIDLEARRLRWLDVHIAGHGALHAAGGYRAALAHIARDFADLAATGAQPTLWDIAAIHATARANIVYVRERSGALAVYRRRDSESTLARLARLHAGSDADAVLDQLPPANAPTWFALLRDDLELPPGSTGYVLAGRAAADGVDRLSATDLVSELAR